MMRSVIPGWLPGSILERHIEATLRPGGVVAHKLYGVMGPVTWLHARARSAECQFCRALGVNGWHSTKGG